MTDVSVVIETVTARFEGEREPLADALGPTLGALRRQTVPGFEVIVVVDRDVDPAEVDALVAAHPEVQVVWCDRPSYFAEKNAGAAAASASVVALLDGDCVPEERWLESLLEPLAPGVTVVAGRTRYEGRSLTAKTFSVSDFAIVVAEEAGDATGLLVNNMVIRRDVFVANPFEERIPRNGGCYLLYHRLRAAGHRIVYTPRAVVAHGVDVAGVGFVRKHFDRGYDGVAVYRYDSTNVLRGSRLARRLPGFALLPITVRRLALDWIRLVRTRDQAGIGTAALPYYALVMVVTRVIELVGGLVATVSPRRDRLVA
jgi:GT2 family glycosyltransferase